MRQTKMRLGEERSSEVLWESRWREQGCRAPSLAAPDRGADMSDLTSPKPDREVHLSLRLLDAFRRIKSESARREVIALVERLADTDTPHAKAN